MITDEIRQLQGDVGFDILMMQEPHSFRHKIPGFGHGVRIAHTDEHLTGRSDHLGLKAGVAVFSRRVDLARVSQLCTRHCAVCEVQAPGFSFFIVSHYFQFRDDIEKHLSLLGKVLNALRGKKVLIGLLAANATGIDVVRLWSNELHNTTCTSSMILTNRLPFVAHEATHG